VGVDHGSFDISVAEQFLYVADVVAGFEQVGGKRMAQGVWGNMFGDFGLEGGAADGLLQAAFIAVMATNQLAARVNREPVSWEGILPESFFGRIGVFAGQGIG
jgi:hypothetical protein